MKIELGRDFQLFDSVETRLGPMLTIRELAANKVLAAFGRHQPRDLADLYSLSRVTSMDRTIVDAGDKDPGFDRQVFREMVRRTAAMPPDIWPKGSDVAVIRSFIEELTSK
jgi:hypothetical protein